MDIKTQTDSEAKQSLPEPTSNLVRTCRRKKSPDAGLVTSFRDGFHEFINAPMADHKVCLKTAMKNTIDKMIAVFPARNSSPKEGESSMPAQASVKN